jgi:hypothetical protein
MTFFSGGVERIDALTKAQGGRPLLMMFQAVVGGLTVLAEDNSRNAPTATTSSQWDTSYPHHDIPVFATQDVGYKYVQGGWPTVYALDENLTITHMPNGDSHWAALGWANRYTP